MRTIKMLTAAATFVSLGLAMPAMANDDASAAKAGGHTNSTTMSTGQGSASNSSGDVARNTNGNMSDGAANTAASSDNPGAQVEPGEADATTNVSPYKKTYPHEEDVGDAKDNKQRNDQDG